LPFPPIWRTPVNVTLPRGMRQAPHGYDGGLATLSHEALGRAFPTSRKPGFRLQRFMAALLTNRSNERGQPLTITVIGGSMSRGTYCFLPWAAPYWTTWCSWPKYLETWLRESFPGRALRVFNIATGGTDSTVWASIGVSERWELREADLVITEFSVNDQTIAYGQGMLPAGRSATSKGANGGGRCVSGRTAGRAHQLAHTHTIHMSTSACRWALALLLPHPIQHNYSTQ
jgi:hypothetical protein